MKELEEIILNIIKKYSNIPISIDTVFINSDITEVDTIMIFIETEMILGIDIPDIDIEFDSVKSYVYYISNLCKNKHKLT